MTESPTPLLFHDSGAGWHLRPRRRFLLLGAAVLGAALLVFGAVRVLASGHELLAVLLLVSAAAVTVLPFGDSRRRLPPTTYEDPHVSGTLLPVHSVRVATIGALTVFGVLLVVLPVVALDTILDERGGDLVLGLVICGFLLLVGLLLLAGAYGGVRSRLTRSRGILLTPTRIVLRTQAEPLSFDWEVLRGVWPHWTRSRGRLDVPSPDDAIHNWLSFQVEPARYEGVNALGSLAGTEDPTLQAEKLASDPDAVLAFCRFYLAHPEARSELGTPAALARFRERDTPLTYS